MAGFDQIIPPQFRQILPSLVKRRYYGGIIRQNPTICPIMLPDFSPIEYHLMGGFIIVGVEDAHLEIVGVPDSRVALTIDVMLRAARQIEPKLL